jgi:formate dehydrogenase maturation protein FdhE
VSVQRCSPKLLEEIERSAKRRDKKRVKFCPICGRKPEEPPQNEGRHIYSVRCEKCQSCMIVHVNG